MDLFLGVRSQSKCCLRLHSVFVMIRFAVDSMGGHQTCDPAFDPGTVTREELTLIIPDIASKQYIPADRWGTPPRRSPHFPQAAWKPASTFSPLPAGSLKSCLYVLYTSRGRLEKLPLRSTHFPQAAGKAASTCYTFPAGGWESRLYVLHTSCRRLGKPLLRSIHFPRAAGKAAPTFYTLPAGGWESRLYIFSTRYMTLLDH